MKFFEAASSSFRPTLAPTQKPAVGITVTTTASPTGYSIIGKGFDLRGGNQFLVEDIGDYNKDGFSDVLIYRDGGDDRKAFVILGTSSSPSRNLELYYMTSSQGFVISHPTDWILSATSAGDINGDGYDDIILGVPYATEGGICYVLYGHGGSMVDIDLSQMASNQGFTIIGPDESTHLGNFVGGRGDVNGDGFDDVLIEDYQNGVYVMVYVIFGSSTPVSMTVAGLSSSNGFTITNLYSNVKFMRIIDDLNGDGKADIMISVDNPRGGSYYHTVIYGSSSARTSIDAENVPSTSGFYVIGNYALNQRIDVISSGDINGDGLADMILGCPSCSSDGGAVFVIYGKRSAYASLQLSSLSASDGVVISGVTSGRLGYSVSAIDVTKDGYVDIIIGAPDLESVFVLYGSATIGYNIDVSHLTMTQGVYFLGLGDSTGFGKSVCGGLDANGDGYPDILVSSPGAVSVGGSFKGTYTGAVYVLYGRQLVPTAPTPSPSRVPTMFPSVKSKAAVGITIGAGASPTGFSIVGSGAVGASQFGYKVIDVGDFNNDGFSDVLVKCGYSEAKAYLILGNSSSPSTNLETYYMTPSQGFVLSHASGISSVSTAGDVNGDGYDDIILGVQNASPSRTSNRGIAYIVYGHAGSMVDIDLSEMTDDQGFTITGASDYSYLGSRVGGGGDVNSDGYDDIFVGQCESKCTVYVIFGSSSPASLTTTGLTDSAGYSIINLDRFTDMRIIKDINGDGKDDLIINNDYYTFSGWYYNIVVYGTSDPITSIDAKYLPPSLGFYILGSSTSGVNQVVSSIGSGDINGDGLVDIILGCPEYNSQGGAVYVVYGSRNPFTYIDLTALSISQGFSIAGLSSGRLGESVSAADINKDGYDDIIVAAQYLGIVYVIYGSSTIRANIDITLLTVLQGTYFQGFSLGVDSVSGVQDINGDGYQDILAGSQGAYSVGGHSRSEQTGIVYVIYGRQLVPTAPTPSPSRVPTMFPSVKSKAAVGITIGAGASPTGFSIVGSGAVGASQFGYKVIDVGDFNNDGFSDILVKCGYSEAKAYLILGNSSSPSTNLETYYMTPSQGFVLSHASGISSVSTAGDVNGDGYDDIILGVQNASPSRTSNRGIAYIVYGHAGSMVDIDLSEITDDQGFTITGASDYSYLGSRVGGGGDVNSDGYDDIFVGQCESKCTVYVIFGSSSPASLTTTGLTDSAGYSIVNLDGITDMRIIKDLNGDGKDDLIMANNYYSLSGWCYNIVVYSTSDPITSIDAKYLPPSLGFYILGSSTSGVNQVVSSIGSGDINGDGLVDIILGCPEYNSQGGAVYVVYGSRNPFTYIDLTALSISQGFSIAGLSSGRLGESVSAADINKDGYDDIIVGAPYSRTMYLIFGTATFRDTILTVSLLTEAQGTYVTCSDASMDCGYSVSALKDFNGDSYPDMIIGAPNFGSGAVTVIFGDSSGVTTSAPSFFPTLDPAGSRSPTTLTPSFPPTIRVTNPPVSAPTTSAPSFLPTISLVPSFAPTTALPTFSPTTRMPTMTPTCIPSRSPTEIPTHAPSFFPTYKPTFIPSAIPSFAPTIGWTTGLTGYYSFEDGSVSDGSGNTNNGFKFGGVTAFTDRYENSKGSLLLDGSSGYISLPGSGFNFDSNISVSFWVYPVDNKPPLNNGISKTNVFLAGNPPPPAMLFDKTHFNPKVFPSYAKGWWIGQNGDTQNELAFGVCDGLGGYTMSDTIKVKNNTWNHLVFAKEGPHVKIYLNAQLMSISAVGEFMFSNGKLPLVIGAMNSGFTNPATGLTNFFRGAIDDVYIYNRPISDSEAYSLYGSGSKAPSASPTRVSTFETKSTDTNPPDTVTSQSWFKYIVSIVPSVISLVLAYLLRSVIADYVISHLGFTFILVYPEENSNIPEMVSSSVVAITLKDDCLYLIHKKGDDILEQLLKPNSDPLKGLSPEIIVEIKDELNRGRTEEILKAFSVSASFKLHQFVTREYLRATTCCCCIPCFRELGIFQGFIFALFWTYFEQSYEQNLRNSVHYSKILHETTSMKSSPPRSPKAFTIIPSDDNNNKNLIPTATAVYERVNNYNSQNDIEQIGDEAELPYTSVYPNHDNQIQEYGNNVSLHL